MFLICRLSVQEQLNYTVFCSKGNNLSDLYTVLFAQGHFEGKKEKKKKADTNTVKTTVDKLGQSTSFLCKGIYITTYVCNMYIFCAQNITQA